MYRVTKYRFIDMPVEEVKDISKEQISDEPQNETADIVEDRMLDIPLQNVCIMAEKYEYALLYMISEIRLCRTSELEDVNWDECLEARFFSDDRELHFFDFNGEMRGVEIVDDISDNEKKDICVIKYELQEKFGHRFKEKYNTIIVQEYLEYDDGQAYVSLTRLKGLEV